jgi:hypothetical protein
MHLRRFWFVLIACFALGPPLLRGQQVVTGTITGSQCVQIDVTGKGMASISVTNSASGSAWSGTIQPQVAIGGDPAQNTSVYPTGSSTAQSTITANNVYQSVSVSGATLFQVCGNTVTNTANIKLTAVALSGRNGGGGGGGGTNNPGGSSGQVQANGGSVFTGFTVGGDGTLNTTTGALSITALHFGSTDLTLSGSAPTSGQCLYAASSSSIGGEGCLTGATANGGLLQTSTTLGLLTSCSTNQVLEWNGSAWACATPGTGIPSGTVGQIITYNSSNAAVATSNIIDNSQSGGTGVTLVGPVTFSGSAFQWYGTIAPGSGLSCGSNAEGFGADSATAPNPSWCNSTGTFPIYWGGNFPASSATPWFAGTGGGSGLNMTATLPQAPSLTNNFLFSFLPSYGNPGGGTQNLNVNGTGNFPLFVIASAGTLGIPGLNTLVTGFPALVEWDATHSQYLLIDSGVGTGGGGTVTAVTGTSPLTSTGGTTPAIGCATCVTSAGSLTSTAIMTGAGSQGSQTPSATATLSSGGNVSFPGTLSADGISYPTSLTSGGVLYNSSSSAIASSGAMTTGQFMLGGGAGNPPTTSFSIVPNTVGGTGSNSSSATGVAQVASGTWSFSTALANGTTATTASPGTNNTGVATNAFVLANAVTNPCSAAAIGSLIYQGSSALGCLAAPTTPTGVPNIVSTIPGSAPTYGPAGITVNAQSTNSYAFATTDRGAVVQTTGTAPTPVISSPGSTGYAQGYFVQWVNTSTAAGTATTTASTINGNSTLGMVGQVLGHNPEASGWVNNGTNWIGWTSMPSDANGRLGCEAFPVLTTDVTTSAGSCAATVVQIEGAAIPASALITGTNSSKQFVATALASGDIFVGNGSNLPAAVAVGGDSNISNTGLMTNTGINGATIPASAFLLASNSSSQLIAASAFASNPQTSTYLATATDIGNCKNIPIASGTFTLSLPASPPTSGCVDITNIGSGVITVSRNGNTINGTTSNFTISAASAAAPLSLRVWSASSGYTAQPYGGSGGGSGVSSFTGDGTILSNSASTGAVTATLVNAGAGTVLGDNGGSAAAPSYISTPVLGVSGTAGTLSMFPTSGNFKTILGSVATATNTVDFFAAVPTNLHTFYCATSSTTCTLTDSGYAYNAIPIADVGSAGLSGTAPVAIASSGAISITGAAGQVLAGASPAFTATPTLGVASSATGTLAFANSANTGVMTLTPASGTTAATVTIPDTTGTLMLTSGTIPINQVVSATGAITAIALGNNPLGFTCALTSGTTCENVTEATASTTSGAVDFQITALTTSTAIPLQITQGAAGPASANAPALISISAASAGGAATASQAGFIGAPINLLTGAGSAGGATTGNGGAGGAFTITEGNGGAGGGTTTNNGGNGGGVAWATGNGGAAAATGTSGNGGNVVFTMGVGGTTGATAGSTGEFEVTGTAPASQSGVAGLNVGTLFGVLGVAGGATTHATSAGGIGSLISIVAGNGGIGNTSGAGGAGGTIIETTGTGAIGGTTGAGGAGGAMTLSTGAGAIGGTTSGTGGVGGALGLTAGAGGAQTVSGNGGNGGSITLTGGAGGNGATTGGNGGNIVLTPGAVGTGGTPTAGAVQITTGTLQIGTAPACTLGTGGFMCVTGGGAPTVVPATDAAFYVTSSGQAAVMENNAITPQVIAKTMNVNVTPVTVAANVTTDQNLMAFTIPANTLNIVGRTVKLWGAGVYSTAASSTAALTWKVKLCTVSGCGSGTVVTLATWTTSALPTVTAASFPWNISLNSSTQTASTSSAYEAHGNLVIDIGTTLGTTDSTYADENSATAGTIDSTGTIYLQVTVAASAGSTSNSFMQRQMTLEVLN